MFGGSDFWLETRVIIKISKKMIPHIKPKVFFIRKKNKKTFFFEKKNSKWPTQKNSVFQNRQFSIFFVKISFPWVSRIDWCEGHWWLLGSLYFTNLEIQAILRFVRSGLFRCPCNAEQTKYLHNPFSEKSSYVLAKYFDFVNPNLVIFNDVELLTQLLYSITIGIPWNY